MLYRVTLTAQKVQQCPLYREGDSMVISFPRVDKTASEEICLLTLAEFLPYVYKRFRGVDTERKAQDLDFKVCHGCEMQGAWVGFVVSVQPEVSETDDVRGAAKQKMDEMKRMPIFSKLPDIGLLTLVEKLVEIHCKKGDVILEEGAPGQGLFTVHAGKCAVYRREDPDSTLAELGPGEVFGEMSLLTDQPCSASIRADTDDTIIYKVRKEVVFELTQNYPALANYFSKLLAERLKKTNSQVVQQLATGFTGKLSHMSPAELIQAIDATEKGGRLTVKGKQHHFTMEFDGGLIYGMEGSYSNDGSDCFYNFLGWKDGSFTFTPCEVKAAGRRPYDPTALLINGLRMQDEKKVTARM